MDEARPRYLVCDAELCDYEVQVACTDADVPRLEARFGFRVVGGRTLCPRCAGREGTIIGEPRAKLHSGDVLHPRSSSTDQS